MKDGEYKQLRAERYSSYNSGKGKDFENGKLNLEDLREYASTQGEPKIISGKQEYLENLINRFI
jgi:xylose isomerase